MTDYEKATRKVIKKTADAMRTLGTYREQFVPAIRTYAEMKVQMDMLYDEFEKSGFKITEKYINNDGHENERKTPIYMAMETLRRDIAGYEDRLGLTPVGMKRINDQEMKQKAKGTALTSALERLGV